MALDRKMLHCCARTPRSRPTVDQKGSFVVDLLFVTRVSHVVFFHYRHVMNLAAGSRKLIALLIPSPHAL